MNIIEEIATYLQTNNVGTIGTDLFLTKLPEKEGTAIGVIDTGAMEADPELPIKHPTFQVFIRTAGYETGKTKLDAVYSLLHGIQNQTLVTNGKTYLDILAMTAGGCLGQDEAGRYLFSINFRCKHRT